MTLATNAFTTFAAAGNKEDVSDVIYNVDPFDCPFMTSIDDVKADNTLHQWQTDALAAASTSNAQLEGDDNPSADSATATTMLSNTCQISRKIPRVSGSQEAVSHYGRDSELAYQMYKRTLELRRDMESILLMNQAEVTGDTTTARKLGSINSWIDANTSAGTGGSDGSLGNTSRTDGSTRAFTEALLKANILAVYNSGGNPDRLMLPPAQKQVASTFTGNATRMKTAEDSALNATIDIYQSDFGDLEIVPNRFMRSTDAFVLQLDLWAVAYLRRPRVEPLSKTGDSERKMIIAEYTLESRNEKGSGGIFDLA